MRSRISPAEFLHLMVTSMPMGEALGFEVVSLERGLSVLRLPTGPRDLRPGGTVAGPVLFSFADLAIYAAVLSAIGPVALAVTTDATMHFLKKPAEGVLVAKARLLKEGRRLIVGEAEISREGEEGPVAHAVMTYSVPPTRAN